MDLEAVSSGSMSNKKAPKGVFHGPAGGFFSQRKKASIGNIKHSGNKKDIFLKSGSNASVYSNIESLSGDDEDVSISGGFDGSLLDSAVNTSKSKRVNTSANFSSSIGSSDFEMDEEVKPLLPPFKKKVPLDKIWIDLKIIKTPVEMSVKKSFVLNINLLAVEGKSATQKTQFIRKIFSKINGFGGATTPLKFEEIIRSTFTSEKSIKKAVLLASKNEINVNSNLKEQGIHSNWAVVIKEIPMDTPKDMIIIAAVVEFADSDQAAQLASRWSFLIGKDSVHVAMAMGDCGTWASRDQFRMLLFILPMGTTVHDLGTLLDRAGGKTCIINQSLDTGNRVHCAVVGFESKKDLDTAFHTKPIFVLSKLLKKPASGFDHFWLAKLYTKKKVPIFCPAAFGGKSWAQVVSLDSSSDSSPFSSGLLSGGPSLSLGSSSSQVNELSKHLAVLKHSLEILADQVSVILKKLSFVELVPLASPSCAFFLAVSVPSAPVVDSDMALDGMLASPTPPFSSGGGSADGLSSSGSKVLTSKLDSLESKMSALKASFSSIMIKDKFDGIQIFTSGLDIGYLGAGIAVIMDNSLACHVSRVKEVSGHLILIWLLFKDKLSVTILDLYAGVSPGTRFAQAPAVNSLIVKAVNSSTFVVLGGNFNKNDSGRSASFKFCLGLGLVNSFAGHSLTIDFILVSGTLSSAVAKHCVNSVSDFFNTDHKSVMVSVGLGGLLDFRIKNTDSAGWSHFRKCSSAKMLKVKRRFFGTAVGLDLDAMWFLLEKVVVDSVDEIFSRHWFCDFQCLKNEHSSKFLGLKLLVAKISALDAGKALVLEDMVCGGQKVEDLISYLSLVRKEYRKSKIFESIIRSVLDWPFQKVVLDHLVVDDKLILEPEKYALLNYVRNDAFSNIMCVISMSKLLLVTNGFLDGKAASFVGMPFGVAECVLICWHGACFLEKGVDGVLTNTRPIALIETARKILSDRIFLACSTSTQSPVFAVGSIVKNALKKNREIWLVLQDMWKAYDSVSWPYLKASLWCIKMCERFIRFFENIHKDRVNRVITDFSLSDGYSGEVFLPLLWRIFYDLLLCEVKRHEHLCEYHVDFKFVAKTGKVESVGGMTSYLAAGVFVDDTIWIGNCQASTQYTLNIAKGLSKPNVSKAYSDVCFFVNVMLKKAIIDKQFSYLVLAVLQSIDVMVRKSLKSKAGLPRDFLDAALHHPSLYDLKTFEQVQSEEKIAALVSFSNASGVLGHLFNYRFLDLQFLVKLRVSPVNNFLAGIVKIFLSNELSLANNFLNAFRSSSCFPLSSIFGNSGYFNSVHSLKCFEVAFGIRRAMLDPQGFVPCWFSIVSEFMLVQDFFASSSAGFAQSVDINILDSDVFSLVKDGLHDIWSGCFEVYTNGSLRNAGSVDVACGAAAYFPVLDKSVGVVAVALALECVLSSCQVILHTDSQAAIDVCLSKLSCTMPDFRNRCWLKRCHIFNLVREKDLEVVWVKVKGHSGISGNVKTDLAAGKAARSPFFLLTRVHKHYLVADNTAISSNACHFVRNIFQSINRAHWKAGPGVGVISVDLIGCVDWISTAKVWHLDSHMLAGFTSWKTLNLCSYLMKTVHRRLPVAVWKRLYDKGYPGVLCLLCGEVEFSNHVFTCSWDVVICDEVLVKASVYWVLVTGLCDSSSSAVLQTLFACSLDVGLYSIVCKGFVLNEWCKETWGVFDDKKQAIGEVVNFVRFIADLHHVRA
ncbi:hypothetical protein G9A89_014023 [Geosiphon pyriformis]|nr:hypothetical protein G9A89_014023 [Geosiphon pyriformis]